MNSILIKNARLVNEGQIQETDVFVKNGLISRIGQNLNEVADTVIDARGQYLMPGSIDDQVHFRDPGLTHKGDLYSEPRAAVAGGVTTFMEMPNTVPNATTQQLLQDKYDTAAQKSLANYSFFMGGTNDNLEEILKTDTRSVCGIKLFMGSSTGNMLVDNVHTLEEIFKQSPMLIATHCEDEATIRANTQRFVEQYGEENIPMSAHPLIRSVEACYKSSSMAVELAKKHNTRLHILHISTEEELALFANDVPLEQKRITAEVCVHHLWFDASQYDTLGSQIKCNPAIKEARHKQALFQGLLDNRLDIIATDHAPHTWEEKQAGTYKGAPSGLPLVQHSLQVMLAFYQQGKISLERIVEKMCHAPAICFQVEKRGFVREGYWADLILVDLEQNFTVAKDNVLYKCGWSPLEGQTLPGVVTHTIVSGHLAYKDGAFDESKKGERVLFSR
ncbi:dihydroorotase [Nibribacter koreensis]|uniref:Dihydroorotase n=1 Tax=Nibribacter koreensis TaxID=1084519 RepID=A0ABP8FVV0_9BACT